MLFLLTLGGAALWMVGAWLISLPKRDVSIVDAFWGPGFVVVAALGFWLTSGPTSSYGPRRLLLLVLVAVWGLRLGAYLLIRNLKMGEEDYRYRAMRERWGGSFAWISLVVVFLLQAVLLWFISLPLQVGIAAAGPARLGWLEGLGALCWLVGFTFEVVGDAQLARFKADPGQRGKVLDTGLWRYTRHPNYFGDFMVWWGFFLIALATPDGWKTVASPLLMSLLLMRVSGVTLLEKKLVSSRPGYREYTQRTSPFFPRPPREASLTTAS